MRRALHALWPSPAAPVPRPCREPPGVGAARAGSSCAPCSPARAPLTSTAHSWVRACGRAAVLPVAWWPGPPASPEPSPQGSFPPSSPPLCPGSGRRGFWEREVRPQVPWTLGSGGSSGDAAGTPALHPDGSTQGSGDIRDSLQGGCFRSPGSANGGGRRESPDWARRGSSVHVEPEESSREGPRVSCAWWLREAHV